jgi:hypothetical protein
MKLTFVFSVGKSSENIDLIEARFVDLAASQAHWLIGPVSLRMDLTLSTGQRNAFGSRECLIADQEKNGRAEDGCSDHLKSKRLRKHTSRCN